MSTVAKTEYKGEVVWLGHVAAGGSLRAVPVEMLELSLCGDTGARHEGATRPSCSRVTHLYPRGTEIRNVRQLSILSREELEIIAAEIGLERLDPALLGASIVLSAIPDFTHLPPGSRLQAPSGLTITVDMENLPCHLPAREIETDEPGHGKKFKTAARGRRGVTAWVERAGRLELGDEMSLFIPQQRAWAPKML